MSDVVAGLEWTSDQILSKQAEGRDKFKGAVVLLALGAPVGVRSRALEVAVERFSRETNSLLVTAAGNRRDSLRLAIFIARKQTLTSLQQLECEECIP